MRVKFNFLKKMRKKQVPPIRIVLNDACNLNCSFCHREGKGVYPNSNVNPEVIVDYLNKIRGEGIFVGEVHLTGGEPTLHPQFKKLVNLLLFNNYKVKITTNGNFDSSIQKFLKKRDLAGVNFSIHTINSKSLKDFQVGKTIEECNKIVENQLRNITEMSNSEKNVKINAVVLNKKIAEEILGFAIKKNIPLRFLPDLNNYDATYKIIKRMMQENRFKRFNSNKSKVGYSGVITYYKNPGGYILGIKEIKKVYNKNLCDTCGYKKTEKCREGFYAIRIFRDSSTGKHMIRLCLDKNDGKAVVPLEKFSLENFVNN